jgi:hypothetical protein
MRRKSTNTEGTSVVCLRIHIGAIRPSGKSGDDGVNGDSGEWAPGSNFRGGNRMSLSTRNTWNDLAFSGCHIATLRWAKSASRSLRVRIVKASWGCFMGGGDVPWDGTSGSGELDDTDESGGSRPATNITGANWTRSSGAYEFMAGGGLHLLVQVTEIQLQTREYRENKSVVVGKTIEAADRAGIKLNANYSVHARKGAHPKYFLHLSVDDLSVYSEILQRFPNTP